MKRTILVAATMLAAVFAQTTAGAQTTSIESWWPSAGVWGTIAFEDNWPLQGDYDMNDLVVRYRIHGHGITITTIENRVKVTRTYYNNLQMFIVIQARGGSYHSGFGIRMDGILKSEISSSTLAIGALATLQANDGTSAAAQISPEEPQSDVVWIFFNDASFYTPANTVPAGSTFSYFNTEPAQNPAQTTPGTASAFRLNMTFTAPLYDQRLLSHPYNPFIFRSNERGREVHLPGQQPTDRADVNGLFGTGNDGGNKNPDEYGFYSPTYVTKASPGVPAGLPWAVTFGEKWNHPLERQAINTVYPKILTWISSGGANDTNWYYRPQTILPGIYPYPYDTSIVYEPVK